MRILLVEDDDLLADILEQTLIHQRYVVDRATDGELGWDCSQSATYDLIVLDVELPCCNGIELCQRLRKAGCSIPILLITSRGATGDRIRGLDAGADDYLIKPLDLGELQARVRALLRRGEVSPNPILQVGALQLDPSCCQVTYDNKPLTLTPKEYALLELLLRNPLRVFSLGSIIEHLWAFDDPPQEESVKSHIKGLRQKLKQVGAVDWIENIYGVGYRLREGIAATAVEESRDAEHPSPLMESFQQAMDGLWQQYQGLMEQRLEVLRQLERAIATQSLTPDLRRSAEQAAHKLAGVLGMFDKDAGTQIARDLEEVLSGEVALLPDQLDWVRSQIHELDALIDLPIPAIALPEINYPIPTVSVLVVDDDVLFLKSLQTMLAPWGIRVTGVSDPAQVWDQLTAIAPDLLILDVAMPQTNGIELCQAIRHDADWQDLPILFVTAHGDRTTIQQLFAAGADDYIGKPVVAAELLTRITNRLERNRLLQTLSTKDPITGLLNQPRSQRAIEQRLQPLKSFYLAILWIASLSQINRNYGHTVGNQVLHRTGQLLRTTFAEDAILGYWGNGEFVIGWEGRSSDRLSTILLSLQQQPFTTLDSELVQVDGRVAIAAYPTDGNSVQRLYQVASQRLAD